MRTNITCWLLPGSFTVRSCSSLYFSKAGPRSLMIFGVETVRALISIGEEEVVGRAAAGHPWEDGAYLQ